ncbi:MAG: hypothetical protein ABR912_12080 [Terracidiphilus sp.]|jgi:hypothetical protein
MRLASWLIVALFALAPVCLAQSTPGLLPLQTTSGTGFTGAPYSGKETTVRAQTLTDGTTATDTLVELLWRDAEGRTRSEMVRHTDSGKEYRSVIVTDPVGGVYLKWMIGYPSAKRVMHIWPVTPAQRVTAPPPTVPASPSSPGLAVSRPGFRREILAPQEINGVYAEGTRTTRSIRLQGDSGNRVIEVTNELWISPELRIIARHIVDDPRSGETTTDVTEVVKGEPDPSLFQAPEGYAVVDHRGQDSR